MREDNRRDRMMGTAWERGEACGEGARGGAAYLASGHSAPSGTRARPSTSSAPILSWSKTVRVSVLSR